MLTRSRSKLGDCLGKGRLASRTGSQPAESLKPLYFCPFGDLQCIVNLNSEVRTVLSNFVWPKSSLHDAQVLVLR